MASRAWVSQRRVSIASYVLTEVKDAGRARATACSRSASGSS
ncbi:MAG: hypothetical protein QOJ06_2891 [Pseudonocardiales bacterium]|jgi:hypothetical protein|nr:hypothetical protein [Pseudonocardiales bacterium]